MSNPLLPTQPAPVAPPTIDPMSAVAAVEAALAGLPESSAPGLSFLAAMKSAWNSGRIAAGQLNRISGGRAAGELLSNVADRLIAIVLKFAAMRAAIAPAENDNPTPGIAILALGSYGRRELAPYSDIDLLFLHDPKIPEDRLGDLVGNLVRPLWDTGWQVGHSVRSPAECLGAMEDSAAEASALETTTSILEGRFVAGDAAFAESLQKRELPEFFRWGGRAFVEAKFQEALSRWQGLSVYRTQPNVKESPGALRDFQLAAWIDRASQLSGHLPRLASRPLLSKEALEDASAGYERLLTFRVSLHTLCKRKQDVLDFAMQNAVAKDLNYESTEELSDSELLLRDYFRSATAVHRVAQIVTRRYQEERAIATRDIERLRRRRVDSDFTRVGDYLYASGDDVFAGEDWTEKALRVFVHAARLGVSVSQDVNEAVRARLPGMTDAVRSNPAAAAHFLELMGFRNHVGQALRAMRDSGLLGAYLPEFGEIQDMVISDVFHDFTVDEHTLCVVEAADNLYQSGDRNDRFRRQVLEALPRPQLLRMACLFHDLGKSRGAAGHSERGALMIPRIGERLGLSEADVRTLIFLVQEHLTLSKISQRRDIGEGALLKNVAGKIGTRERLDLLFLLTYCDSISVGHGAYPLWKDALLAELYSGIFRNMAPAVAESSALSKAIAAAEEPALPGNEKHAAAEAAEQDTGALEAQLLAWAKDDADRALAEEHCRRVPRRYLVEVGLDEAALHLETLKRMRDSHREAVAAVRGSGSLVDMWVVSTDRPKRFSQICGAFLGAGVSVISAIAYTRDDGIILDHFRIAPGLDDAARDEVYWKQVSTSVEETLCGKGDFRARIEAARRRIPRTPLISRRIEPEVQVDNKLSDRFTVVDIVCGDRIGLLYGLSRALSDLSCDIHFAKIATNQGLVTDVFYISETGGGQVTDPEKMMNIKRLLKAVASDFQEAKR